MKFTFPLAGILASADYSASGNVTTILHLRERIFCNYFGPVPLEEIHNKLCIPASGNTKRTAHIRFADMQADVCSTASGTARNSVIFNTCCFSKK